MCRRRCPHAASPAASAGFFRFTAVSIVAAFLVSRFVPETMGRSYEQVHREWAGCETKGPRSRSGEQNIMNTLTILGDEGVRRIDAAARSILGRTGAEIPHEEVLALFRLGGGRR
jgi:hypothetical protein